MIQEHLFQDYMDLMTIYIGKPEFQGMLMRVPVRDLRIWKGYQGFEQNVIYTECILVFEGIALSIRRISEYIDQTRKGFKAEYVITDGPFPPVEKQLFQFHLEGVSAELNAYVNWNIIANNIRIENPVVDSQRSETES